MIKGASLPVVFIFLLIGCTESKSENDVDASIIQVETDTIQNSASNEEKSFNEDELVEEDLPQEPCHTEVSAFVSDEPGEPYTNIRNAPGGEVILKLPHESEDDYFILEIDQYVSGWFRIKGTINGKTDYEIPPGEEGWIHHSVISAGSRNYGNQPIHFYEEPNEDTEVNVVLDYESSLIIYEACGEWVRCSYYDYETGDKVEGGWIKTEWLCGNPLTNCC